MNEVMNSLRSQLYAQLCYQARQFLSFKNIVTALIIDRDVFEVCQSTKFEYSEYELKVKKVAPKFFPFSFN